ncbi:MAG: sulfite exporter TauE/SafE family protein [Pseudolabrys sp.]
MDGIVLTVFLLASFLGGLTSGLAGFAMGLVVSGIYLHILTPIQTATLIVGYGFVTQGYGVWALRHAVRWRGAAPFIIGGLMGVPAGTMLLTYIDPAYMRIGVGILLVVYSIYSLARPAIKLAHEGVAAEVGVGFLNGLLAGLTGLVGIVVVIWCQLRNWPKDVQRAIFQPVLLATILTSTVSLSAAGAVTAETMKLYLLGLPCMLAGTWAGLKLYGRLNDAAFRKIILLLLLVSGLSLIVPMSLFR